MRGVAFSIRWRLTLWNGFGVAAVLLGFAALLYWLSARALWQHADRTADSGFRLMEHDAQFARAPDSRAEYWVEEFDEHMGVLAAIFRPDGTLLHAHSGNELRQHFADPSLGRRWIVDGEGHRWRRVRQVVRAGSHEVQVLLLIPVREQEADLAAIRRAIVLTVPVGLLVTILLAYWLAQTALRPVDDLRQSAERITAERLDERLPVVNPNDELGRLATTINAMIARLEQSFTEIRRFTADASHELRTPLTALRTEAEVALASCHQVQEYRELTESMLEECARMTRLTEQLLTLAREDAGVLHVEREQVDMGALVHEVVETLRPIADSKGIELAFDETTSCTLLGVPIRLRQVVMNLVDNALKYTDTGGRVRVRLTSTPNAVELSVSDTGCGIADEHLPKVFDRFYRVDKARSRDMGGTGLGLSIVKSIVTAHGGTVAVQSESNHGSTFTVVLPIAHR